MANIGFSFRSALGLIPKTENIESHHTALKNEYAKLLDFTESDIYKEYSELKKYIESDEFISKKREINSLDYKKTEEYQNEQKFLKLRKDKKITNYFKVLNSQEYKDFLQTEESEKLKHYQELKEYLNSEEHTTEVDNIKESYTKEKGKATRFKKLQKSKGLKKYLKIINSKVFKTFNTVKGSSELADYEQKKNSEESEKIPEPKNISIYYKFIASADYQFYTSYKDSDELREYEELKIYIASTDYTNTLEKFTYKNSDEYKKEQEFATLKKDPIIVKWEKFRKSKAYKLFLETKDSSLLHEYLKLKEYIESDEFIKYKEYMLDKNKWEKTDEYTKEQRYKELSKSDEIKWYFSVKDSKKFDELKRWKLVFEDDFTEGKIDENRWMNSYFWGKMILDDRYVIAGDKQYFTDNKNIKLNGTTVKIVTKKEKTTGKVWHPIHGFFTQEFEYTSGMLSTAHSHRQQYGRIEAKIKLAPEYPVYQAFWLKGEKILPEVDILKFNMDKKNRLQLSSVWGDATNPQQAKKNTTKVNGASFTKDYFIYTLDWEKDKLTWKINGIEVYSTTEGVPQEPLYLLFSAGLQKEPESEISEQQFEIDWVRCYEKAE